MIIRLKESNHQLAGSYDQLEELYNHEVRESSSLRSQRKKLILLSSKRLCVVATMGLAAYLGNSTTHDACPSTTELVGGSSSVLASPSAASASTYYAYDDFIEIDISCTEMHPVCQDPFLPMRFPRDPPLERARLRAADIAIPWPEYVAKPSRPAAPMPTAQPAQFFFADYTDPSCPP
ncbi:MAG: hypothetical protein ABIO72_01330 [Patescibacteria group bacterium]